MDRDVKVSKVISILTQAPILIALLLSFVYLSNLGSSDVQEYLLSVILLFLIPIISILLWSFKKDNTYDLQNRKDRLIPYIITSISFTINTIMMCYLEGKVGIYCFISISYLIGAIVLLIINLKIKVSVHAAGVSIFSSLLIIIFGIIGSASLILIPVVIWSRYHDKKHNVNELLLGGIIGFLIPLFLFLVMNYLFSLNF